MTNSIQNSRPHVAMDLLAVCLTIGILYLLKSLIMPVLFAMILSVMIFPVQHFLEKNWRCNRLYATFFSILIIFLVAAGFAFIVSIQFIEFMSNGEQYSDKLGQVYSDIMGGIEKNLNISKKNSLASSNFDFASMLRGNFDSVLTFVSESGSVLSDVILVPIYTFFFLYYRSFFRKVGFKMFKKHPKSFVNMMIRKIYKIQQNYLVGLIKVITIVGILNTIGLFCLGIENAIFFGFFAALLLLIPYIGVVIGSILPALVALATKDSAWYAFGVIAIFSFIQFIEGNFITPKITGSQVKMNSFIAIFTLIAFAMLWGIAGMVVALPITATLKIIFDHTPRFRAIGYLIGEPTDRELTGKSNARLLNWKSIRANKKESD